MKLMRAENAAIVEIVDVVDTIPVLVEAGDGSEPPRYGERPARPDDFFPVDLGFVEWDGKSKVGWVDAGKGYAPPPAQVPVVGPRRVTAKQIRYALNASGQRAAWEAALAAQSDDTRDYWVSEPDFIETSTKIIRVAKAAKVDLAALFAMAALQ